MELGTLKKQDRIGILGYGLEGEAMLKYLVKHGFLNVTVCDMDVDLRNKMPEGVSVRLGPDYLMNLEDFDVVFRSPGIRYLEPEIQLAKKNGVRVSSVTAFFMDQCPCEVVGVTGTKGKGTTCTLIYLMLQEARAHGKLKGEKVHLCGNIGEAAVGILDDLGPKDFVVLELSSFQLQDLEKSPHYAVLLNTSIDHLDYHADRGEYMRAKENLLAHQGKDGVAVLNRDYEYVEYYGELVKGEKCFVSRKVVVGRGAYERDGKIFYAAGEGVIEPICDVNDIALIGSHNVENVLMAVVIARKLGVSAAKIKKVVKEFKGLPHRLEFVREVGGVRYFNDSFATTTETSMAAVDSFDEPTVLIAGGHDKGLDYKDWALKILEKPSLKAVVLIGDTAEKMFEEIEAARGKLGEAEGSETKVLRRDGLKEAVEVAAEIAGKGWVVVMSPAAASFGLFKNYKERGEKFGEIVRGM